MPRLSHDPKQDELPLASVNPALVFEGRHTLYVREVARVLRCDEDHVINLIHEFEHTAGERGLKGFSIARGADGKVPRACWRIAASDFRAFIEARATSHTS